MNPYLLGTRGAAAAAAMAALSVQPTNADEFVYAVKLGGPYEYYKMLGVIAEVLPDNNMVGFKSCNGDVFEVPFDDLVPSNRTCETEPRDTPVPVSAECEDVPQDVVKLLAYQSWDVARVVDPLGTNYVYAMEGGDLRASQPGSPEWRDVVEATGLSAALVQCQDFVILPTPSGEKWIGLLGHAGEVN